MLWCVSVHVCVFIQGGGGPSVGPSNVKLRIPDHERQRGFCVDRDAFAFGANPLAGDVKEKKEQWQARNGSWLRGGGARLVLL